MSKDLYKIIREFRIKWHELEKLSGYSYPHIRRVCDNRDSFSPRALKAIRLAMIEWIKNRNDRMKEMQKYLEKKVKDDLV